MPKVVDVNPFGDIMFNQKMLRTQLYFYRHKLYDSFFFPWAEKECEKITSLIVANYIWKGVS